MSCSKQAYDILHKVVLDLANAGKECGYCDCGNLIDTGLEGSAEDALFAIEHLEPEPDQTAMPDLSFIERQNALLKQACQSMVNYYYDGKNPDSAKECARRAKKALDMVPDTPAVDQVVENDTGTTEK